MKLTREFVRDVLLILVYCIAGAFAMTYFMCGECHTDWSKYIIVTLVGTTFWFAMWMGNGLLADYTTKWVSWTDYPVRRFILGIIGTVVYSVGIVVLIIFLWSFIYPKWFANYAEIIIVSLIITFLISTFIHSREFLINWKKSVIDAEKFQKESIKAQYESLKNQVNPHFLFNSLNALTNLVYEDPDKAAKFIKQLSEVYRYVLDTRDKELVPLEEELKFLDSYLFLQQIRYGSKLKIENRLGGVRTGIAPLALQMLVENAIKHNVISEESPLSIRLSAEDSMLVVENTLNRRSVMDEGSAGLGLENIRKRYGFLSKHEVEVSDGDEKFQVKIPFLQLTP